MFFVIKHKKLLTQVAQQLGAYDTPSVCRLFSFEFVLVKKELSCTFIKYLLLFLSRFISIIKCMREKIRSLIVSQ